MSHNAENVMCRLVPDPDPLTVGTSLSYLTWGLIDDPRYSYARGADWSIVNGADAVYVPFPGFWSLSCALSSQTGQPEGTVFRLLIRVNNLTRFATAARTRVNALYQGPSIDTSGSPIYIEPGEPIQVQGSFTGGAAAEITSQVSFLGVRLVEAV